MKVVLYFILLSVISFFMIGNAQHSNNSFGYIIVALLWLLWLWGINKKVCKIVFISQIGSLLIFKYQDQYFLLIALAFIALILLCLLIVVNSIKSK